jgi:hypothetical protein
MAPVRPPAFFFQPNDVLVNFGHPGEQEMRFKRSRAIFLRLYPTYADQPRVGLSRAIEVAQRLMPLQRLFSSLNNRNHWGAINLQPRGDGITSFTQIFETGELWGASEEPFRTGNPSFIAAIGVEKAFVAALENHRLVYERELKLLPPFTVEFGAVGLTDQHLLVPSIEFSSGAYAGPIRKENFSRSFQLGSFDTTEWKSALRDFLIDFYDLAAQERSKVLIDAFCRCERASSAVGPSRRLAFVADLGREPVAFEELAAEMNAAFCCASLGIVQRAPCGLYRLLARGTARGQPRRRAARAAEIAAKAILALNSNFRVCDASLAISLSIGCTMGRPAPSEVTVGVEEPFGQQLIGGDHPVYQ